MGLLKALALLVANWFGYKSTAVAQRRATVKDKAKRQREVDAKVVDIQKAVNSGDEDAVNKMLERLGMVLVIASTLLVAGCRTPEKPVVYIPESARAIRLEPGKLFDPPGLGWYVPDARMTKLSEDATRWKEHQNERGTP